MVNSTELLQDKSIAQHWVNQFARNVIRNSKNHPSGLVTVPVEDINALQIALFKLQQIEVELSRQK